MAYKVVNGKLVKHKIKHQFRVSGVKHLKGNETLAVRGAADMARKQRQAELEGQQLKSEYTLTRLDQVIGHTKIK